MKLPIEIAQTIGRLERAGYAAYVVGGAVRDGLLGRTPQDWDLCTSATPTQMEAVFAGAHLYEIGRRFGTVTLLCGAHKIEITTFRRERAYQDGRHPSEVCFTDNLNEDLCRRDFTIGAMAYHPKSGLVDPFCGREDLENGILRAVGQAEQRFAEDSLRILRGLRFAARFGLQIEAQTAAAMRARADSLCALPGERIYTELCGLITAPFAVRVLRSYAEILFALFPALAPMQHCAQQNPYHQYDVWQHTLHTVGQIPNTPTLRLAALLHDSGKPACKTVDQNGIGHFYGHAEKSLVLAEGVLDRLRCARAVRDEVLFLIAHHDMRLQPDKPLLKKWLSRWGEARLRALLMLQKADAVGQGTHPERIALFCAVEGMLDQILTEKPCLTIRQLALSGGELMEIGYQGAEIGRMQRFLLEQVLCGAAENQRASLLKLAAQHKPT